jgi:hypothetical protein
MSLRSWWSAGRRLRRATSVLATLAGDELLNAVFAILRQLDVGTA